MGFYKAMVYHTMLMLEHYTKMLSKHDFLCTSMLKNSLFLSINVNLKGGVILRCLINTGPKHFHQNNFDYSQYPN